MPLLECPDCGWDKVSTKADRCPQCGCPVPAGGFGYVLTELPPANEAQEPPESLPQRSGIPAEPPRDVVRSDIEEVAAEFLLAEQRSPTHEQGRDRPAETRVPPECHRESGLAEYDEK